MFVATGSGGVFYAQNIVSYQGETLYLMRWAMKNTWLLKEYTTQLYRNYCKPLQWSLWNNQ